jgi:hypothetical protein
MRTTVFDLATGSAVGSESVLFREGGVEGYAGRNRYSAVVVNQLVAVCLQFRNLISRLASPATVEKCATSVVRHTDRRLSSKANKPVE